MRYIVTYTLGGTPQEPARVEAPNTTEAAKHIRYAAVDDMRMALAKQRGRPVPGGGVIPNYEAVELNELPAIDITSIDPSYSHQAPAAAELAAFKAAEKKK